MALLWWCKADRKAGLRHHPVSPTGHRKSEACTLDRHTHTHTHTAPADPGLCSLLAASTAPLFYFPCSAPPPPSLNPSLTCPLERLALVSPMPLCPAVYAFLGPKLFDTDSQCCPTDRNFLLNAFTFSVYGLSVGLCPFVWLAVCPFSPPPPKCF